MAILLNILVKCKNHEDCPNGTMCKGNECVIGNNNKRKHLLLVLLIKKRHVNILCILICWNIILNIR